MSRKAFTVELPYPPSVNHYWRRVGPRTLISREGRRFRERVASIIAPLGLPLILGAIELRIVIAPPDRRRRDVDNVLKSLLDSMKQVLYEDDSQIEKLSIERIEPVENGATLVEVHHG